MFRIVSQETGNEDKRRVLTTVSNEDQITIPSMFTITLSDSSSAYSQLNELLGLINPNITSHIKSCDIMLVSFNEIICQVTSNTPVYIDVSEEITNYNTSLVSSTNYSLSVQLNGYSPYFSDGNILYYESIAYTPIAYDLIEISTNVNSITSVILNGTLLWNKHSDTQVYIDDTECSVSNQSNANTLFFSCLDLSGGNLNLILLSTILIRWSCLIIKILIKLFVLTMLAITPVHKIDAFVLFTL